MLRDDRKVPTGERVTLRWTGGKLCGGYVGAGTASYCPEFPHDADDQFLRRSLRDDFEPSAFEISESQLGA
jgi:hypothetical protein